MSERKFSSDFLKVDLIFFLNFVNFEFYQVCFWAQQVSAEVFFGVVPFLNFVSIHDKHSIALLGMFFLAIFSTQKQYEDLNISEDPFLP